MSVNRVKDVKRDVKSFHWGSVRLVASIALAVFTVHGVYHLLADGLGLGYTGVPIIGPMWEPGFSGMVSHTVETILVTAALVAVVLRRERAAPPHI